MRLQTELSDQAFGLLADMIGGQAMTLTNTSPVARRMEYVIDGKVIDRDVVDELFQLCAIWPERFGDLDNVPLAVTKTGYDYVRATADA